MVASWRKRVLSVLLITYFSEHTRSTCRLREPESCVPPITTWQLSAGCADYWMCSDSCDGTDCSFVVITLLLTTSDALWNVFSWYDLSKSFLCAERNKQLSHNVNYLHNITVTAGLEQSEYLESLCTIHLSHYCSLWNPFLHCVLFPPLLVLTCSPLCPCVSFIPLPCNAIKCTDTHAVQDKVTPLIGAPYNGN